MADLWGIDGTGHTLRSLAAISLRDAPDRLERLMAAVEAGDARQVRETAHAIRGAASIFGAEALMGIAADIEKGGEAGRVPDEGELDGLGDEARRLDRLLGRILGARGPTARERSGQADGDAGARRHLIGPILVVDDDEAARRTMIASILQTGLRNPILEAADADSARQVLATHSRPALVVIDVRMPGASGLELLAWIRAQPGLRSTPVVVVTVAAELAEVDRAFALDASAYLLKPVGYIGLRDVLLGLRSPWLLGVPPDDPGTGPA